MERALRYLGLDIANCTGWALVEGSRIIQSGVRDFSLKSNQTRGKRGIAFYNFLHSMAPLDGIFYEKVQFTANRSCGDGGELHNGLLMLVEMTASGYCPPIPAIGVHVSTLKKAFTGHGHAEKVDICRKAHEMGWKGGYPGTDRCHDEADAIALVVTQLRDLYNVQVTF